MPEKSPITTAGTVTTAHATVPLSLRDIPALRRQPELDLLARSIPLRRDPQLAQPFRVMADGAVVLGALPQKIPAVAVLARHAFEIAIWQSAAPAHPDAATQAAFALLAARTAGLYRAASSEAFRRAADADLPPAVAKAHWALATAEPWKALGTVLGAEPGFLQQLSALGSASPQQLDQIGRDIATQIEALNLFIRLSPLAAPLECLLASGGDTRIATNAETGRNAYGSSLRPIAGEISFSSSTASSISAHAYLAAEAARQRMIAGALAGQLEMTYRAELTGIRAAIAAATGAETLPGTEIVLAASGTDAALIATGIAALRDRPIVSIVMSAEETGSGVPQAAAGRHFSTQTALDARVRPGEPIEGLTRHAITLRTIPLRTADGRPRPAAAIDADVAAAIDAARTQGAQVVLHVLEGSKTGMTAPSPDFVKARIAAQPDGLDVVVDACQMRLGRTAMRAWLEAGAIVQVTGSKFFGGPPFSGALVLPPASVHRLRAHARLPQGLGLYSSRYDWPETLAEAVSPLSATENLGLLLRWAAAAHEMQRYAAIPDDEARGLLERFAADVTGLIEARPELRLCEAPLAQPDDTADPEPRTIIPFVVLDRWAGGTVPLPLDRAKLLHQWLARDAASLLPATASREERVLASRVCLIGQPVSIPQSGGKPAGALRLCSSARLVAEIWAAGADGREDHYRARLSEVTTVLDKIALIAPLV